MIGGCLTLALRWLLGDVFLEADGGIGVSFSCTFPRAGSSCPCVISDVVP
ncbi:hypothetical protein PORCAN_798 [Porphyromonas crevioricanis JCM 13913]|nr:hypothetical protein PORCAN_798 [Porphyromonas crevioricanis JCM 13913]